MFFLVCVQATEEFQEVLDLKVCWNSVRLSEDFLSFEHFSECGLISGEPGDGGLRGPKGQCRFLKWTTVLWSWCFDFGLCVQRCFLIQLWCHLSRWLWFSWCTWTSWRERSQRVNWWVFWLSDTDNSSLDLMWPQFGPLVKRKSRNAAKQNWNCKQCLLLVFFRIIIQNWAII